MKLKALLMLLVAFIITGCSVLGKSTPTPLPTVVLTNKNAATPQPSSQFAGGGVSASGNIVPAQDAQMAFSMGEIVKTVNVAVGDQVKAGQVLVTLAGSEKLEAAIEAASLELLSAQQALKTLNDNADQARAAAQLQLANAQKALDDAQKHRTYKNYRNGSQSSIEAAQADVILAKDALKTAQDVYSSVANRADDDVYRAGALSALSAAQKAYDKAVANLNYLLAMPNPIDVNQAEAELRSAQADVQTAQQAYDSLKNGPDPDALTLAQARIKNAQAQVAASQSALSDLVMQAPFDGTVSKVNIHSGEWVIPGQPVLVVTDLSRLDVETTDLSERDVPQIKVGQPVSVSVKALNQDLTGHVSQISPLADTLGGDVVYQTTIQLDTIPPELRAGMSVVVQFGQ